jgi:hypothetical protein
MKFGQKLEGYNGFRSWNGWNVALWISNDEPMYTTALDAINKAITRVELLFPRASTPKDVYNKRVIDKATRTLLGRWNGEKTPDGARFNKISIKEYVEGIVNHGGIVR